MAETFRRRKDGEEWALEMERNIDRNGSSKPRVARNVRTFGDLIDLPALYQSAVDQEQSLDHYQAGTIAALDGPVSE